MSYRNDNQAPLLTRAYFYYMARLSVQAARVQLGAAYVAGPMKRRVRSGHLLMAVRHLNEAAGWREHARARRKAGTTWS